MCLPVGIEREQAVVHAAGGGDAAVSGVKHVDQCVGIDVAEGVAHRVVWFIARRSRSV